MNANPTILVVDDEWLNRELIEGLLSAYDYTVVLANDANMAHQMLTKALPHLIVMDVRMPDVDGYTLCKQVKTDPRTAHIPVIMITALEMTDKEKQNITDAGADDAVSRMTVTTGLIKTVERYLPSTLAN